MSFDNLLVQRESAVAVLTDHPAPRLDALDARLHDIGHAVLDFQRETKNEE